MCARSTHQQPPSPLDAYVARFLRSLDRLPDGYSPVVESADVAEACDVVPAFVEALFVSARTRGFIQPFRAKSAKGRYRWQVSNRGQKWLAARAQGDRPTEPERVEAGGGSMGDHQA